MKGRRGTVRQVRMFRHRGGEGSRARDDLAVEEPLEMRVSAVGPDGVRARHALAVTMRTPGDDFELVAGFLHGEGLVRARADVEELTYCRSGEGAQEYNIVEARLRAGVPFDAEGLRRHFYTTSSCGVCGKASLEAVQAQGCAVLPAGLRVEGALLPRLPDRLQEGQLAFLRTGGLHGAGLFDPSGTVRVLREDVGRHNAVDKALGHAFLEGTLPLATSILVVSGRASFEIVQKAVAAGVPVLVAVGAPSSLAVELAATFGQTLVGFARDGGFNVYTGADRVRV